LRILSVTGHKVKAVFDFDYSNGKCAGNFYLHGVYNEKKRTLNFTPGEWINRSCGYTTVGMEGKISSDGSTYSGRILSSGCKGFELSTKLYR